LRQANILLPQNKKMINTKLLLLEYAAKNNHEEDNASLAAIKSIRKMISQIDFSSEVVPIDNAESLIKLMVSLKGEQLSALEINVLYDIVNH
jgi:hypothetical protein